MKKRIISVIAIIALCIYTGIVAVADNSMMATRNRLKSKGTIVYQKGNESVIIDSEDLYLLADQIDYLKVALSEQLAEVNTYFTNADKGVPVISDEEIKVVHSQPASVNIIDPLDMQFDVLLEGLAASQSIPNNVTDYGYEADTGLYKTPDGKLTTDTTQAGIEQISISAATADNLSAGTAAWVNGELLLGTGVDNQSYYNNSNADIILNLIDIVYSGITKDEYYEVTDYIGNGLSSSAYRSDTNGTTYGKHIGGRSVIIPVWDLNSTSNKKLLNKITIERSGKRHVGVDCTGGSDSSYRVYTEEGNLILESKSNGVDDIVIDIMTLPISTQYIYIECESTPYATVYKSHSRAECSVTIKDIKATYLINS